MLICTHPHRITGCGGENPNHASVCQHCGRSLHGALRLLDVGRQIKSYRIVRLLGYGGYGAVYEAQDMHRFGERVALKEAFDFEQIERFYDILYNLKDKQHANLPTYQEAFQADGKAYLVMEFVPGQNLDEIVEAQKGALPEAQVVKIALQLFDLLHYLHSQRPPLLHRDIKPANILWQSSGLITLVDFGLMKRAKERTHHLAKAASEPYAPLEQLPNSSGLRTTQQSDIYSLAATLYHLLTGVPPLSALLRIGPNGRDMLTPPNQINRRLSADMADVIMKAMGPWPEARYATVIAFRQAFLATVYVKQTRKWGQTVISVANAKQVMQMACLGTGSAHQLAWAQYSKLFAVASSIGVIIYHAAQLEVYRILESQDKINDVAFAPNGYLLAAAVADGTIELWDSTRGILRQRLTTQGQAVHALAFSPDSKQLASGSSDHRINLWDVKHGTLLHTFTGHSDQISSLAFTPNGQLLASAANDGQIYIWQCNQRRLFHRLRSHSQQITRLAFAPDEHTLFSASGTGSVKVWDVRTGTLRTTLQDDSPAARSSRLISKTTLTDYRPRVAFAPDGRLFATSLLDGRIKIWDNLAAYAQMPAQKISANLLQTLPSDSETIENMAFAPNGTRLATISSNGTINLWEKSRDHFEHAVKNESNQAQKMALAPNSGTCAVAFSNGTISLWDATNGQLRHKLTGHSATITELIFSPDSQQLASACLNGTIKLWNVRHGTLLKSLTEHTEAVWSLAFSANGQTLASASEDQTINLWQMPFGLHSRTLQGHSDWIYHVAFSPNGHLLASASEDKTIRLWDSHNGNLLHTFRGHEERVSSLLFAPNGQLLASACKDQTIKLWNISQRTLHQTLAGIGDMADSKSMAFTANSQHLAFVCASQKGSINVWDINKQTLLHTLSAHGNPVTTLAFAPKSTLLASASQDKTINLWDTRQGTLLHTLTNHTARITSLTFSADGKRLASCSADGSVRLWWVR